jgi:hypothetical protein
MRPEIPDAAAVKNCYASPGIERQKGIYDLICCCVDSLHSAKSLTRSREDAPLHGKLKVAIQSIFA